MNSAPAPQESLPSSLEGTHGPDWWRRLEAWSDTPEFRAWLEREYPSQLERIGDAHSRRDFLRLMGASLAVSGLAACTRQPEEKIVPFARNPEALVPGRPRFFATAMPLDGAALGILVESHMGRPTKVEGNPDHPASLGATDAFAQAAVLGLYDPDRSHSVLRAGQIGSWDDFSSELQARLERLAPDEGRTLRLLVGPYGSPTLAAQLERLLARWPLAKVYRWTPLHRDQASAGAKLAFGRDVAVRWFLDRASVIVSLDADFLLSGPAGVRQARDFATGRRARADSGTMSRCYVIESGSSLTGANADERLAVKPSELEGLARALARELGLDVQAPALAPEHSAFVSLVAARLSESRGTGLVLAGESQSPAVHALVHALNEHLGNAGRTVEYAEPPESVEQPAVLAMGQLVSEMRAGSVDTLIMLGGNPVYDAPAELDFGSALAAVPLRVHLAPYEDETSRLCHWHLPETHFLESWSDVRAFDGTVSIVQPLIAPLYGGISPHELVEVLAGERRKSAHDLVREHWRAQHAEQDDEAFARFWDTTLHDGVMADTRMPAIAPELLPLNLGPAPASGSGLEIVFRRDASVHDGRFANNAWLQELPRPLTRLVWDNAALVSARTAAALGAGEDQVVAFESGGRTVEAPLWILPGQPDDVVTMHLGYGRHAAGRVGAGRGFDAYRLRTSDSPWWTGSVRASPIGTRSALVSVQDHGRMEGRDIVRVTEFDRFRRDPLHAFHEQHGAELSLYPPHEYTGHAWAMVIDLTACIGCNACMVACQAENNVPVVGKEQCSRGRELHWLRIDRYFAADEEGREHVHHQPVPCMHCENAPCEVVCPVGATMHSDEGLNEMVYNRCVGTRYCANNCPYKVRRFNFFHFAGRTSESEELGLNPDVTVRTRGVMEKCTYCVQRINQARIESKKEEREIRDGEIVTACQQACPTQAIVFGDKNDPASAVSALRREPHHYGLLAELGTRPRTTYLAKLENPDPGAGG